MPAMLEAALLGGIGFVLSVVGGLAAIAGLLMAR